MAETNLFNTNGEPYFDDFDASKNFMQILFKPGVPVQVRELNQLQTILHDQRSKFSDHIFKHGALINGNNAERMYVAFVTIDPTSPFNSLAIDDDRIRYGINFVGATSGVEGSLVHYVSATETDPATAYFNYTKAGVDNTTFNFIPGEVVNVLDSNDQIAYSFKVRCTECPGTTDDTSIPSKGMGVLWRVPEGIYYVFGFFVEAQPAIIVGEKYGTSEKVYDVGFEIITDIVTIDEDESLFDNTLGYPNDSAPGADRARIRLNPIVRTSGPTEDNKFIKLASVIMGSIQYIKNKTEYADIMKMLAERTYDESGNYTVNPFRLSTREHLSREAGDGGMYEDGDENKFIATLSAGKAYVKGYQVETIADNHIEMEKARDTFKQRRFFNNFSGMNYILIHIEPNSLFFPTDTSLQSIYANLSVDLHNGHTSGGLATGAIIGTLKAYDIELDKTLGNDLRVVQATMTAGGSGYTNATVTFSPPSAGGTQATGTAVIVGGAITAITINNPGSGYSSTPTITITGNGTGAGATAQTKNYGGNIYRLYYTSMVMNTGYSFDQVKSLKRTGTITFNAAIHPDDVTGVPVIYNNTQPTMIWKISDYVQSTRDIDNADIRSLAYTSRQRFQAILDSAGTYQWIAPAGEYFTSINPNTTLGAIINTSTNVVTILSNLSSVLTITPDKLSVNLTSTYAGYRFILFHNVMKSNVIEKKKSIISTTEQEKSLAVSTKTITLTKSDLYEMIKIERYDINTPNQKTECTNEFTWTTGQTDYGYIPIVLTPINSAIYGVNDRFDVQYSYYEHGAGDFFSIDSYQEIINDPSIDYQYGDVPTYKAKNGTTYDLRDCLDFRPLILNTDPLDVDQPSINGQFSLDLTTYLPRIDLIVINQHGQIFQKKGISDKNPIPPKVNPDGSEMAIYEMHMDPYVLNLEKNAKFKFIENKRYTMRDIGRLEQRIANVEYYTSFSLMELALSQTSVTDENGFNRFKNGFAADNFQNFQFAEIDSSEFRAALDRSSAELRPEFTMTNFEFDFDPTNSLNYKQIGDVLMLDYTEQLWMSQDMASKHLSVNPYFIFNKIGTVAMDPAYDNWADTNALPDLTVNLTTPAIQGNANVIGKDWGAWKNVNVTGASLGDRVTDVKLKTYMRSIPVKFYAAGLRANIRVFCFFDDIDVTQHCRPLVATAKYGDQITTDANGKVSGEFLIPPNTFFVGQKTFRLSNDPGNSDDADLLLTSAEGIFWSGGLDLEKQKTTLNVITPVTPPPPPPPPPPVNPPPGDPIPGDDPCTKPKPQGCFTYSTNAAAYYGIPSPYPRTGGYIAPSGSGKNSKANIKALWDQLFAETGYYLGASGQKANKFIKRLVQEYHNVTCIVPDQNWCNPDHVDPVAQSFYTDTDSFITAVDVYFQSVAANDIIFVQIVTMQNGYPTRTVLGECRKDSSTIEVSTDTSKATKFTFLVPIYVKANTEYAIVVGGSSPDTRVWISKLGEKDIATNVTIETQPTLGSLFKSQNASTWTASQYEDLKFRLYRAEFVSNNLTLAIKSVVFKDEQIYNNPFETEEGSTKVRVYQKNHGVAVGDKFRPRIGENTWIELAENSGTVCIGQTITTETGSAKIRNIVQNGATREVYLTEIVGHFSSGQDFSTNDISIDTNETLTDTLNITVPPSTSGIITGTIDTNYNIQLNGIPIDEFNGGDLVVTEVDSAESYIVEVTTEATLTGFCGGDVILDMNKQYQNVTITGSYLPYGSTETWTMAGVGHEVNGLFAADNYVYDSAINIQPNEIVKLEQPYKIINDLNTTQNFSNNPFMKLNVVFSTPSVYVSPVINLKSFSAIAVHNIVDYNVEEDYEVEPNATDRLISETDPIEGVSLYKYVSQTMVLDTAASDARIYVDVHKPQDSDFDVYVKVREPYDSTDIDELNWILVEDVWKSFTSINTTEFREVEINLGNNLPLVFDGTLTFDMLKIKIVGKAKNPAKPPRFKLLRIIAVT